MTEQRANPTDAAVCRLLAAGPLPTTDLAAHLEIPARTARHRLCRLRQAGAVVTDEDGRHHLAVPADVLAGSGRAGPTPADQLPARVTAPPRPEGDLAAPLPAGTAPAGPATGSVSATGSGAADASPSGGQPDSGLAAAAIVVGIVGLAAAGWLALSVLLRRMSPPAPAAAPGPLTGFGQGTDPWGDVPWTW